MKRICPCCKKEWEGIDSLLCDANVEIIGYQPDFNDASLGLFLFNHKISTCKSTFTIPVIEFESLSLSKLPSEKILPGGEGCMGYCLDVYDLRICTNPNCASSPIRKLMQLVKDYNVVVVDNDKKRTKPDEFLILVVDDEPQINQMISTYLQMEGFKTLVTGSGTQALNLVSNHLVDLVISDLLMPEGDGLTLLDQIRVLDPIYPKFLLMTGFDNIDASEYYQRGVSAVIRKPMKGDELVELAYELLDLREGT